MAGADITKGKEKLSGVRNPDLYPGPRITPQALRQSARRRYVSTRHGNIGYEAISQPGFFNPEPVDVGSPLNQQDSRYDEMIWNPVASDIQDIRAFNQPWYLQLGAGLTKAFTTAGTTFVDGTLGLLTGLGKAVYNSFDGDENTGFWEGFYNNPVSNGMRQITQAMEEILPNYRSRDEIENPWAARNIFSMNTIADDFIKNLGFTVGAFYSGNAYLSAFKAVKAMSNISPIAAGIVGSAISGVNEGRIEAGQVFDEQVKIEKQKLDEEYKQLLDQINSEPENLTMTGEGQAVNVKQQKLAQLQENYQKALNNIHQRATGAANTTLLLNSLYLPVENFIAYGRLYQRGFKMKAELAGRTAEETGGLAGKSAAELGSQTSEAADRIEQVAGKRRWKANLESRGKAAAKGLGIGAAEGFEELNQRWFSSGATTAYSPTDPQAYYKALTDPEYQITANGFMEGLTQGFNDSYKSADGWKEFAIGALTGLLGMPTFGSKSNSANNTYLGHGKAFGLSGGVFGTMRESNILNRQAEQNVQNMNSAMEKIERTQNFLAKQQAFADAMSGFEENGDKFNWENVSDDMMFSLIDTFSRAGRMQALRDIVNEDFENFTPEQLQEIANSNPEEWKDITEGKDITTDETAKDRMRQKLSENKNTLLRAMNEYENSIQMVRGAGYNRFTDEQVRELAWLDWKRKQFETRFKSVRDDEEVSDFLKDLEEGLAVLINENPFSDDEKGKTLKHNIETAHEFIKQLLKVAKPQKLVPLLAANEELSKFMFSEAFQLMITDDLGMALTNFEAAKDLLKMVIAQKNFIDKFNEYITNPDKIEEDHQNVDEKNNSEQQVIDRTNRMTTLQTATENQIIEGITKGEFTIDELIKEAEENNYPEDVKNKLKNIKRKFDARASVVSKFEEQLTGFTQEDQDKFAPIFDALERTAFTQSTDVDNYLDASAEAWQDMASAIERLESQGVQLTDDQLQQFANAVGMTLENAKQHLDNMPEMPDGIITIEGDPSLTDPEDKRGGKDNLPPPKSQAQILAEEKAKRELEKRNKSINDAISHILQQFYNNFVEGVQVPDSFVQTLRNTVESCLDQAASINIGVNKDDEGYAEKVFELYQNTILERIVWPGNPAEDIKQFAGGAVTILLNADRKSNGQLTDTIVKTVIATVERYIVQSGGTIQSNFDVEPSDEEANKKGNRDIGDTPAIANQSLDIDVQTSKDNITYNYWKPLTSRYPIHFQRGNPAPWYTTLPDTDKRKVFYEIVYKYLESSGAFERQDNLQTASKPKRTIRLGFSNELQQQLREAAQTHNEPSYNTLVLLMFDQDGNVIGDLGSEFDAAIIDSQVGLRQAFNKVADEYRAWYAANQDRVFYINDTEYPIFENMIGKIPFTEVNDRHSLNDLNLDLMDGNKSLITVQRRVNIDSSVRYPDLAKVIPGTPLLLLRTVPKSGIKYIAVPMTMRAFDPNDDSELAKVIVERITGLVRGTTQYDTELQAKDDIMSLLALDGFYVERNSATNTIRIRKATTYDEVKKQWHYRTIYKGPLLGDDQSEETLNRITNILNAFKGTPYNVSVKLLGKQYLGHDYNHMIGEIAQINLPQGTKQTVSNWFVIRPDKQIPRVATGGDVITEDIPFVYTYNNVKYDFKFTKEHKLFMYKNNTWVEVPINTEERKIMIAKLYCYQTQKTSGNVIIPWLNESRKYSIDQKKFITVETPPPSGSGSTGGSTGGTTVVAPEDAVIPEGFDPSNMPTGGSVLFRSGGGTTNTAGPQQGPQQGGQQDNQPNGQQATAGFFIRNNKIYFKQKYSDRGQKVSITRFTDNSNQNLFIANFSDISDTQTINKLAKDTASFDIEGDPNAANATPTVTKNPIYDGSGAVVAKGIINYSSSNQGPTVLPNDPVNQYDFNEIDDDIAQMTYGDSWSDLSETVRKQIVEKCAGDTDAINTLLQMADSQGMINDNDILSFADDQMKPLQVTNENRQENKINLVEELRWLGKVLPQVSHADRVRIVKGFIKLSNDPNGAIAFGLFKQGIIHISDKAIVGTVYHEAFHYVFDTLLSDKEKARAYIHAREIWGNLTTLELEEKMAESFRHYVMFGRFSWDTENNGFLSRLWRKLKTIVQSLFGLNQHYLDGLFRDINRGKFAQQVEVSNELKTQLRKTSEKFLKNFGITIQDVRENFTSEDAVFDALNKTLNIVSAEDLTYGMSEAIAFMLRGDKTLNRLQNKLNSRFNGMPLVDIIDSVLIDFYNLKRIDTEERQVMQALNKLFSRRNIEDLELIQDIQAIQAKILTSIQLNDMSLIVDSYVVPTKDKVGTRVSVAQAIRENPWEANLVRTLNKYGITLGGSTCIAAAGSLYRPSDNPFHDLDFNAYGIAHNKLYEILRKEFKYVSFYAYNQNLHTFLVMDRPYTVEKLGPISVVKDKQNGNIIATISGWDIKCDDGVHGKLLNFFNNGIYHNDTTLIVDGKPYVFSDYRNALRFKIDVARDKDIFDYNTFILNPNNMDVMNAELRRRIAESSIIWGHPALGKTTYLQTRDDIIEWDELVNKDRNAFIRDQIDPEHQLDTNSSYYMKLRQRYMIEMRPEYVAFLTERWNWLKAKARAENKKIMASPLPLLKLFPNDFDLVISLPKPEFMARDSARGGNFKSAQGWKDHIDEVIETIDPSKVIETQVYLSDLYEHSSITQDDLEDFLQDKLSFEKLTDDQRQYILSRGISMDLWDILPDDVQQNMLNCM